MKHIESYDALNETIGRFTNLVRVRLRLSDSIIRKWKEPFGDDNDSGARNPLDRILATCQVILDATGDRKRALLPIAWLAAQFDCILVDAPTGGADFNTVLNHYFRSNKELGELLASVSTAMADGSLSRAEAAIILKEGHDAQAALAGLLCVVQQSMEARNR